MDQAQQLRNIIKSQQIQMPAGSSRVITVTSGKGGVGKTNISVNLAIQFRRMGKRVVIFDADFGLANIEVMLGVIPKYTLKDVFDGKKSIKDILTQGPMGIMFISGGSGISGFENLTHMQLARLVKNLGELDEFADIIIVDTGAGLSESVLQFVAAGQEVLLVLTSEPTSLTDSYSLLKALHNYSGFKMEQTEVKVIANKVFSAAEGHSAYTKLNVACTRFLKMPISYLGNIPQDEHVMRSVINQTPVSLSAPNTRASKAYERIAYGLLKQEGIMQTKNSGLRGMFTNYLKKLGING